MSIRTPISIKHQYRQSALSCQYIGRVLRAVALRTLLRLCLLLCKVESRFNPIIKDSQKKILVIVIGGMGDCLLFDPLFRRLKERWPQARIDVLTGCFEQMWERMGSVSSLLVFKPTKFKSPWAYARLFRTIYRNGYDIVAEGIAMMPKRGIYPLLTSFVLQASKAEIRIGRKSTGRFETLRSPSLGFMGQREMLAKKNHRPDEDTNPYLTHIVSPQPPHLRRFHESAYIFEPLGLSFHRRPDEPALLADTQADQWAHALLRTQWGKPGDIIIGMTVETTRQIKTWPLEYFAQIVETGVQDAYKFVILGLNQELGNKLSGRFSTEKVFDLTGRTDLGEMIALIGQCDAFFSGDTGPAHIAQACRVPTVVLFGPSNEREFGPVDIDLHTLILPSPTLQCRPCVLGPCVRGKSCIQMIRPESAYLKLKQTIDRSAGWRHKPRFDLRKQPQQRLCEI
jgi:ADP-heptose:LPS heptosyltransferase